MHCWVFMTPLLLSVPPAEADTALALCGKERTLWMTGTFYGRAFTFLTDGPKNLTLLLNSTVYLQTNKRATDLRPELKGNLLKHLQNKWEEKEEEEVKTMK